MEGKGRLLHIQAEQLREKGEFVRSLELLAQAIAAYQAEKLSSKIAECAASQALSYRHLFDKTASFDYLILAKHAAMAGRDIAQACNDVNTQAICEYNLGKVLDSMGDTDNALISYRQALDLGLSNRPGLLAEMKTRLAVAEYKEGDEAAFDRFTEAVEVLKSAEEKDNYAKSVWLSGAYMHMAEAIGEKNKEKTKELLDEAQKIINSDLRLRLREQQLKKIRENLK